MTDTMAPVQTSAPTTNAATRVGSHSERTDSPCSVMGSGIPHPPSTTAGSAMPTRARRAGDGRLMRRRPYRRSRTGVGSNDEDAAMDVLSMRTIFRCRDLAVSRRFWEDTLGLTVAREYGVAGEVTGVVLFAGGGFVELTSSSETVPEGSGSA